MVTLIHKDSTKGIKGFFSTNDIYFCFRESSDAMKFKDIVETKIKKDD
jgi:hypothetical protein